MYVYKNDTLLEIEALILKNYKCWFNKYKYSLKIHTRYMHIKMKFQALYLAFNLTTFKYSYFDYASVKIKTLEKSF